MKVTHNHIKWLVGGIGMATAAVLVDALFLEQYFFQVKEFEIGKKGTNKKLRLLLLADLHFKDAVLPRHHKLAAKVNELQPDLILIAGDTLDRTGGTEPVQAFLRLLDRDIPKVAVAGNHDHIAAPTISKLQSVFRSHNGELLLNQTSIFQLKDTRLAVTGLDDFIEGDSRLSEAVQGIGKETHHFLLLHRPVQQEQAMEKIRQLNAERPASEQLAINYIFAGHIHGGQVRLPGVVPYLPGKSDKYIDGWYNEEAPFMYVSKGFGTSRLPIRFFARSEVALFHYGI